MDFNSYLFVLIFLPLTIILYHTLNSLGKFTLSKVFLLGMSIWFYMTAGPLAILVILADIAINYLISTFIFVKAYSAKIKKATLIAGIAINIISLLYFKYTGFISEIISSISKGDFSFKAVIVPLGISYITFSQIAYLVDTYRDNSIKYNILDYSLFILFFPKITVGPITFTSDLIPQFNDSLNKKINYDNMAKGLMAFAFGLSKKVLLADNLAAIANFGYDNIATYVSLNSLNSSAAMALVSGSTLNSIEVLIIITAYTLQIYFDFSGFCDMAQGICLMMNINLPVNFNSPYRALSVNDFWKRWHITLTRFFRQYVYFPLGGNRKGNIRTYINIFIIFFLSGLWHGASYTFIVWGAIHGIFMCISKAISNYYKKIPRVLRLIITFMYANLTWVFFRATTIEEALAVLKLLFTGGIGKISTELAVAGTPSEGSFIQWLIIKLTGKTPYITALVMMFVLIVFSLYASIFMKNTNERVETFTPSRRSLIVTIFLLVWSILSLSLVSQFIYVNF